MLPTMGGRFMLILISLLYIADLVATQDAKITIPLNKSITFDDREMYGSFITLNGESNVKVNFSNVDKSLEFIVFQVHSHLFNVSLTMTDTDGISNAIGTNVGLVSFINNNSSFQISNHNKNVTVRAYISVHGYKKIDPIPGGCNSEFNIKIYPFLYIQTFSDYILIEAAAPSSPATDRDCIYALQANITFYMMYLPEQNFYADPYFTGIRKMMTLKGIEKYGTVIPYNSIPATRRRLSAYPGTGAIYAVVARSISKYENITPYSVYVPSYSYGCTDFAEGARCEMIDDWFSQMLCAGLLFIGVFLCFFGHRFFKTEMFFTGFFSGVIITYILIALITVVDKPALLAAAAVSGIFFGAIWWLFWWLYGIPVLAVLLPSLNLGFLLASIFYYRLPGNIAYLQLDFNFWSLFILVMMLTALAVVSVSFAANILCCAVLGAYAAVLSIDYHVGSNYKFIIINVLRRAVVPHFNTAFLAPPDPQWRDVAVGFLWLVLAILGFLYQHWHNRGRPPFPPPPRAVRPSMSEPVSYGSFYFLARPTNQQNTDDVNTTPGLRNERTPLLA